jgi:hypothetical protein
MPRPIKDAVPEQTSNVSVPLPPDDKNWLNGKVRANDTTIGAEIRGCIQRARDHEELTPEVLRLLFGDGDAGLVFLIGRAMREAGGSRQRRARDQQGQARAPNMRRPWWADPDGFDAGFAAVVRTLEEFRPEGERTVDREDPQSTGEERYVIGRVAIVVEGGPAPYGERSFVETARALLGPELITQSRWLKARHAEDAMIVAARAQSEASEPISPALRQEFQAPVAAPSAPASADALSTSPPQTSPPPPAGWAHPFLTAWLLSRAMLLGQTGAEPDEAQIATHLAGDGTLRFLANLHHGPVAAGSVVEYYHWLLEHDLGRPTAQSDAGAATPPARAGSSRSRKRSAASDRQVR